MLNCSCTANPRHHRHEADLHKSEFYQLENWPINIFNMRISHKLNRTGETPRSPCPHYRIAPVKWHVMIYLSPFPHILSLCATIFTFLSLSVCLSASQCKSQSRPQSRSQSRTRPPASEHLGEGHRETIDVSCGGCDANCDCNSDCD